MLPANHMVNGQVTGNKTRQIIICLLRGRPTRSLSEHYPGGSHTLLTIINLTLCQGNAINYVDRNNYNLFAFHFPSLYIYSIPFFVVVTGCGFFFRQLLFFNYRLSIVDQIR